MKPTYYVNEPHIFANFSTRLFGRAATKDYFTIFNRAKTRLAYYKDSRGCRMYQVFSSHYCRLREYMRSESEKSFDECQMKRARLQSLGLAYLSPQNKSLAQSFRYMRHKPTIIAFKTPSLENYEAKINALTNQVTKHLAKNLSNDSLIFAHNLGCVRGANRRRRSNER